MNAKYPYIYGIEVTSLLPQFLQKIKGRDTTYYVQGEGDQYFPAAGQQVRPDFKKAFSEIKDNGEYHRIPVIKQQYGGPVERTDNTRVASGRPQQVNNKIPYGASKGPAGEGPMRLFNDPYINMGMMAMGPSVSRFKPGKTPSQYANGVKYAPPTIKDIINNILRTGLHELPVNPEVGISLNSLVKYTGKSPEQINSIMLPKYGDMRIETLPGSKRQLGIWRIKGDKDLVLNEVLKLLK